MSKKLILGIVVGVAAVAVVGVLAKKTNVFDSLLRKLKGLADEVEDKFTDMEHFGLHDVIPKGEDKNVSKSLSN